LVSSRILISPLVSSRILISPSGRVSSSFSTSGTRRVNLVTNPVISHEWEKDREVLTTSGTYPWSFVTYIFHNGQPSHGGNSKTLIFEILWSRLKNKYPFLVRFVLLDL
jgi:hypothetical protein